MPKVLAALSVVVATSCGSSRSLSVVASSPASVGSAPVRPRSARISATSARSSSAFCASEERRASISCVSEPVLNPSADRVEVTCESVALGESTSPSRVATEE